MHISKPLTSQLLSQFTAILGFAGPHCVCSLLLHFLYAWILNGGLSWNEKQHTLSQVKLKYLHISIDGTLDWLRLHIYILHVHGLVVNELFRSSCAVVCDGTQLAQMCMLGLRLQWRVVSVTLWTWQWPFGPNAAVSLSLADHVQEPTRLQIALLSDSNSLRQHSYYAAPSCACFDCTGRSVQNHYYHTALRLIVPLTPDHYTFIFVFCIQYVLTHICMYVYYVCIICTCYVRMCLSMSKGEIG